MPNTGSNSSDACSSACHRTDPARATLSGLRLVQDNAPAELLVVDRWVCWDGTRKADGKLDKTPVNPTTGGNAKTNDATTWSGFDQACELALRDARVGGVGLVLTDSDIWAMDLDHIVDRTTGEVVPPVRAFLASIAPTYVERSPSGDGLHVIYRGRRPEVLKATQAKDAFGPGRHLEVFGGTSSRYLTMTGVVWDASATVLTEATQDTVDAVLAMFPAMKTALPPLTTSLDDEERKARRALQNVPADDYDLWVFVGMALAATFPDGVAKALWIEWSRKSAKYDEKQIDKHWPSFHDKPGGKTIAYVYWLAKQYEPSWRQSWQAEQGNRPAPAGSSVSLPSDDNGGTKVAAKLVPWVRQTLDELLATQLHPWVVQRYFRAGQLGFLCAFPTVGKSTLAASWIMATLYGRPWGGQRVKGGSVVALVGEGRRGFANRLDAYRRHYRLGPTPEGRYIEIVDFKLPLSSSEGQAMVRLLIKTITTERGHAPTLLVIDTLSSHWAESEDSAEFGAPAMRALADIAQEHACAVIVVHHVTKAKGKFVMPELADIRGSSSFACNTDFVFAMCATKDDEGALLSGLKMKDDETPPTIELGRVSVPLGHDEDGNLVTAALLEPGDEAPTVHDPQAAERLVNNLALDHDVQRIVEALAELGSATKKDAVVLQAHMKAPRGRACFDIAMSKGFIDNTGTKNNPVYVVKQGGRGERKEPKEGRDVGDVPAPVRDVPDVRDDEGRRDDGRAEPLDPGDNPLFSAEGNRQLRGIRDKPPKKGRKPRRPKAGGA